MKTSVVNCREAQFDVYIGRPSRWGNPFEVGIHGNRQEVIALYREHLLNSPKLMAALHELRGKVLGCWCKPADCHGDVLAELADKEDNRNPYLVCEQRRREQQ